MFLRKHYFLPFVRKTIPVEILVEVPLRFTIFTLRHKEMKTIFFLFSHSLSHFFFIPIICLGSLLPIMTAKRLGKAIFYTTTRSLANQFHLPNVVSEAVS